MKAIALEVKNSVKYKEPKRNRDGKVSTHGAVMKVRYAEGEKDIWSWENAFEGVNPGDIVYLKRNGEYLNYNKDRKFVPMFDTLTTDSLASLHKAIVSRFFKDVPNVPLFITIELSKLCDDQAETPKVMEKLLQVATAETLCYLPPSTFADIAKVALRGVDSEQPAATVADIPF